MTLLHHKIQVCVSLLRRRQRFFIIINNLAASETCNRKHKQTKLTNGRSCGLCSVSTVTVLRGCTSAPAGPQSLHDTPTEKHESGLDYLATCTDDGQNQSKMLLLFKDIIWGISSLYGYVAVEKTFSKGNQNNVQASSKMTDFGNCVFQENACALQFPDQAECYLSLECHI